MSNQYILRRISPQSTDSFHLDSRMLLIGNAPDNDIVIDDKKTGQCTVKISIIETEYVIERIGNAKVLLNGRKVGKSRLHTGDRIEIGSHVFLFDKIDSQPSSRISDSDLLSKIYRIVNNVGKERDLNRLLNNLISTLAEITGGTEIFIFILDHQHNPQVFVSNCSGTSNERFSDTIVQKVLALGEGLCIPHALADPDFKTTGSIIDLQLQSVVCAPIKVADRLMGLIYVGSRTASVSFTLQDLEILNLYATIAGMLIKHVEYISQQSSTLHKLTANITQESIIAESKVMQEVLDSVSAIAASDITVLLSGETGTGKSRIAQIIHQKSNRATKPFMVLNCSAIRGELLESELFGHKKGSFTGAHEDHQGLLAAADGGTVFLDEIGEMEPQLQAKLLRSLETSLIRPIGATREIAVNVRFICATNRDLPQMVADGHFRADLFYRINQFLIEIPPLRKRGNDLLLLAYAFLENYKIQYPAKDIFDFHPDTIRFISNYNWPGNIRELSNMIHGAILRSKSPLVSITPPDQNSSPVIQNFEAATRAYQKELLQHAIELTNGNKEDAARILGLSRSTFYRYQSQLGL